MNTCEECGKEVDYNLICTLKKEIFIQYVCKECLKMEETMSYGERPSKFVKTADLKTGDKITFKSDGEWRDVDFSKEKDGSNVKNVFQIDVSVNGKEKQEFTLNSTSGNNLAEKWGGESWSGKIAKVAFVKMMVFSKMQDVLCLEPTEETDNTWEE